MLECVFLLLTLKHTDDLDFKCQQCGSIMVEIQSVLSVQTEI